MAELNVPTSSDLRARLREACDSAGAAPTDAWELTEVMLTPEFLGHPDPAIRDELVYVTLCDWILEGALRAEQLRTVLATVTDDEHLFRLLGALDDDAAVLRSFSVLIVPPLLVRHRRSGFFEPAELQGLAARLAAYIHGERDLRGYDPRLGWVHAVVHASDAIGSLLRAAELGDDDVHRLLAALRSAAASQHHVYAHGEDERLAGAITIGLGRGTLSATERNDWFTALEALVQDCARLGMPDGYARFVNVNHVLRAMYFMVEAKDGAWGVETARRIKELLSGFSKL